MSWAVPAWQSGVDAVAGSGAALVVMATGGRGEVCRYGQGRRSGDTEICREAAA